MLCSKPRFARVSFKAYRGSLSFNAHTMLNKEDPGRYLRRLAPCDMADRSKYDLTGHLRQLDDCVWRVSRMERSALFETSVHDVRWVCSTSAVSSLNVRLLCAEHQHAFYGSRVIDSVAVRQAISSWKHFGRANHGARPGLHN